MIICKECGKQTAVPIKSEFLCYPCYAKKLVTPGAPSIPVSLRRR